MGYWALCIAAIGLLTIMWLYVAARMITRAIVRTLEERRKGNKDGKENATTTSDSARRTR